ncbi:hypothetical protein E2562_003268 [Oryza meyeriana var. granulata]|uniref:Membrane-associated kinase regulator 2 n=1 Tax=Oryza meyeriana var. granulata TaxID=110450 RepID=A0A6G1EE07_9ORYZ|nr:hypothetical protein E2562_003268 [Oryza meyeriana var. granulata]
MRSLDDDIRTQSPIAANAMATEEEGTTSNGDVVDDAEEDATSSCFDLDLTAVSGDQWEADFACGDGGGEAAVNVELQVTSAEEADRSAGGVVVLKEALAALGPASRLRGLLLRKLWKSKAVGNLPGGGGAASEEPDGQSLFLATPRSEAYAIAGEERRATTNPKEAARKYLSKITSTLARRRGARDSCSPARHCQATAVAFRSARGGPTGDKTMTSRSSVAAALPTPSRRRDYGSAQHLQDGIESAIAHCKLSLARAATASS